LFAQLVSKIFNLCVPDPQRHRQTDRQTDRQRDRRTDDTPDWLLYLDH